MSRGRRLALAQSLDSKALLRACIDCEPFLEFFFNFEEIIVPEALKNAWGHTPTEAKWQKCVLLQQEVVLNLQETTIKQAITDYLEQFKSRLPSKSQIDDAMKKKGESDPTALLKPEAGENPNWKLVFWFFPNLAILVAYESMFLENHLARLWLFLPQHLESFVAASLRATRTWEPSDVTHFPNLSNIDKISGQALRGVVKFCLQRKISVQEEEEHHSQRPLPSDLWCTQDRIDLINMEMGYWLDENYTFEVIEEMYQIYQSLENFVTQLWKCARQYAIEDGTRDARNRRFVNQNQHPDPDNIGPESELIEAVVCKQAVERLLVTLGTPRPPTKGRFNMINNFAAISLDEYIWGLMESNPVFYKVRPTETFRDFVKRWRSETILRQTRDADFFEKAFHQLIDLRQQRVRFATQAAMQREEIDMEAAVHIVASRKQVNQRKRCWISTIIDRAKDVVLCRKRVGATDEGYGEDGSVEFIQMQEISSEGLPPRYPTSSPVPESALGMLQEIVVSKNRLVDNRKHK
ncbi:hypothetical protein L211DRAFT_867987 [Terfezia boudieri ATCC MYA-4762]|uniref:Uncharacterized protein n=1 Tax=Terfezia boudieri ATCC MYA-4762 TaxID=1051890 RepID=A0A3N4LRB9_9PEZI|nr:hypothetical protein L211DRAFT_867987 [Terfezia boudieri ATCC MYA-4762]